MTTKENEIEARENDKVILGAGDVKLNAENFMRVQDYNGDGYTLQNGEQTKDIIAGKHDIIENAVKSFFKSKHRTEVKVHNIVPAEEAASVFVESVGTPHFYTYAVVPIDKENKTIKEDAIFTQEGEVESAITTALYAMMYEEEFANLDAYLNELSSKYPITGLPIEAVEKAGGNGYSSSYYFLDTTVDYLFEPYKAYIENPSINKQELKEKFSSFFDPEWLTIAITLYMSEEDVDPDEELYDKILSDIESMDNLPPGAYSLVLHDNLINFQYASGSKKSSINKTMMESIIKE